MNQQTCQDALIRSIADFEVSTLCSTALTFQAVKWTSPSLRHAIYHEHKDQNLLM